MNRVEEFLNLPGVIAVGEFDEQGKVVAFQAAENVELPESLADLTAKYCATVDQLFATLADSFTDITGMQWTPSIGWVYAGGEYTVAVSNRYGVFGKTIDMDFNDLFNALAGAR